ncbi:MAG: cell wall hydrolase [Alphaproteobacteria bacterium]|nr:cell wall hydrolase [Alphaproteobacteria bacterium]
MTDHDLDIFARTVFGEARGEYKHNGPASLIAVANVIMNRLRRAGKYGKTLTEVCLKPRHFSCWNQSDPNRAFIQQENLETDPLFHICMVVVKKVIGGAWPDLTRGADHYHASSCLPYWARPGKVKLHLGRHIFYKLDEES